MHSIETGLVKDPSTQKLKRNADFKRTTCTKLLDSPPPFSKQWIDDDKRKLSAYTVLVIGTGVSGSVEG